MIALRCFLTIPPLLNLICCQLVEQSIGQQQRCLINTVIRQRMTAFHSGLSVKVQSLGSRYYVFCLM